MGAEADPEFGSVLFATRSPVTFTFIRNTEKSSYFGATYGQDIEPSGMYLLHQTQPTGHAPRGWEEGLISFRKPLVLIDSVDGKLYGPTGWKARLHAETGKKKRALSRFLMERGFDGIVTFGASGNTGEIVALRV